MATKLVRMSDSGLRVTPNSNRDDGTETDLKTGIRLILFVLLIAVSLISSHTALLVAQTETEPESGQEAPETFVPTEKLPADSAISFPVDI